MEKLIGMTEFILELEKINGGFGEDEINKAWNYANFLKTHLGIGQFVPAIDGKVLEEPKYYSYWINGESNTSSDEMLSCNKYKEAISRVLFDTKVVDISNGVFKGLRFETEGTFKAVEYNLTTKRFFYGCNIVEDLIDYNLNLTPSAINLIQK